MFYYNPNTNIVPGKNMPKEEKIALLREKLREADAVVIGAGSGLSSAAGYVYTGYRMDRYFGDFAKKYGFSDMYTGGFYPYRTMEEFWGFWCRYIWINRYAPIPSDLYERLLNLVKDKDYFVLTTNVDHCFQRAGFDKKRLFYTQGDYGLFQSSDPHGASAHKTYDNYEVIKKMVLSEGYQLDNQNNLIIPENTTIKMTVPNELVPYCPDDGKLMTTNLRSDDRFVEDEGWHKAANQYYDFMDRHDSSKVLYLELGVGMNTPVIIKFPFWKYTEENKNATYACINYGEAAAAENIVNRSVCINADINEVVEALTRN